MNPIKSVSEVAKLARVIMLGIDPTGRDFYNAARQLGYSEAEVPSVSYLAMHEDLNRAQKQDLRQTTW